MTTGLLKVFHIIALCLFIGSIPSHIILGVIAQSGIGEESFAALHHAKYVLTYGLTGAGIALTLLSGGLLVLSRRKLFRAPWFLIKLFLVAAIVINGAAVLTPLAEQMKDMALVAADTGVLATEFHAAESQEAIAGGVNLIMILIAVYLAVARPSFRFQPEES